VGLFDKVALIGKAKKLAEAHADKVSAAIDKVADVVDDKTGGKYADKIDKGAKAAKGFIDADDTQVAGDPDPATAAAPAGPVAVDPEPATPTPTPAAAPAGPVAVDPEPATPTPTPAAAPPAESPPPPPAAP
jgi:hypothetical protein